MLGQVRQGKVRQRQDMACQVSFGQGWSGQLKNGQVRYLQSLCVEGDPIFSCVSSSINSNFTEKRRNGETERHLALFRKGQDWTVKDGGF